MQAAGLPGINFPLQITPALASTPPRREHVELSLDVGQLFTDEAVL
jgi:hypothetical protein